MCTSTALISALQWSLGSEQPLFNWHPYTQLLCNCSYWPLMLVVLAYISPPSPLIGYSCASNDFRLQKQRAAACCGVKLPTHYPRTGLGISHCVPLFIFYCYTKFILYHRTLNLGHKLPCNTLIGNTGIHNKHHQLINHFFWLLHSHLTLFLS